jgi:2-desacetyl-2-hydroxyethyl bacteriochlorophyllide A dehydrogenase
MSEATAVWFPSRRSVELRVEPLPRPGPSDVQVETLVSGLSHGTEMLVYRGEVPADLPLDLPTLRGGFGFPIKYGYASVGRVVEIGPGVHRVALGDLVFAFHPHQTAYVVPEALAVRLPDDLSPESGVFLANVETAVNAMLDAQPRLGDRVAVFGQGVVGLLLAQLLRRAGAELIVAVDRFERRRALARDVGADLALAPEEADGARMRALTGGIGMDLAFEASGNPAALAAAIEAVGQEANVVVTSWYGTKPVSVPLGGHFHRGRVRVISSQVGSIDPALAPRWDRHRRRLLALDLLPRLQLEPLISHRIPLQRAVEAFELVDRRPEETVQVVLTYGGTHV